MIPMGYRHDEVIGPGVAGCLRLPLTDNANHASHADPFET